MGSLARLEGRQGPGRSRSQHLRLRASFWTSVGVVALLLVLQASWRWTPRGEDVVLDDVLTQLSSSAKPRRLISPVYPNDLVLTKPYYDDPRRWLVILHCIAIGYMLIGLNTVCDKFFTGALEVMVKEWKIKPDVAGATFMAAGGSMPELFTSLIGVTVESDVGFSTIVGSAVFNVLFVIGLCGYVAKEEIALSWWPLFRDCSYYIISLIMLAYFCYDQTVELYEAFILFGMYLLYCIMMANNSKLEAIVDSRVRKQTKQVVPEEAVAEQESNQPIGKKLQDEDKPETTPEATPEKEENNGGDKKEEEEDEPFDSFLRKPEGTADQIVWYLSVPIYHVLHKCIPEPTKKWFLVTFLLSLLWIGLFSFVLVWCVEILGDVIFRGDPKASIVMGFTILAAGTSVPDAVSSVTVARQGEGDMAVSSSIGSNIFDILFGLPVPWIIKLLGKFGSGTVRITSPYIVFYVLLLLFMVFLTVSSIHFVGWKLNKLLGICMAGLYAMFLITALIVEIDTPEVLQLTATSR